MNDWPKYESHKIVQAAKIIGIVGHGAELHLLVAPTDNASCESFQATEPSMTARAKIGDWAMLYPDGFKSVSPAKAFEEGYTLCP